MGTTNFSDLGLDSTIIQTVKDAGYASPTPIQEKVIPLILQGKDVVGCAQTGTGKTASFVLPMIQTLSKGRARARMPRCLILEPTRELALQVKNAFEKYSKGLNLTAALLVGGESFTPQEKALSRGVDILIVTPGRLIDLFERQKILPHDLKTLILDEADRMLDMGFIPDVEKIVSLLPPKRQTLLLSATMRDEISTLAKRFLTNPTEVSISASLTIADTICQKFAAVKERTKKKSFLEIIEAEDVKSAIVFCNRKTEVTALTAYLKRHKITASPLHGDIHQSKRKEALEEFKDGKVRFLIASDVAARGINVNNLPFVINFDVPQSTEDYIHRIGRTGRAGASGVAITLVDPTQEKLFETIKKETDTKLQKITLERTTERPPKNETKAASKVTQTPQNSLDKNVTQATSLKKHKKTSSREDKKNVATSSNPMGFGEDVPDFLQVSWLEK